MYDIYVKDPGYVEIDDSTEKCWKDRIKAQLGKNKKIQIVVLFLNQYEQRFYPGLKKMLVNVCNIPSQFIKRRTLISKKSAMSSASKILIQMNVKIGLTPW